MVDASPASPERHEHELELFFDGECPLCRREVAMMQRLDRRKRIVFTDIAAPGFDPAPLGRDHATLMASIHARLPDGSLVTGVEAFRRAYAALGLGFGPLVALSRLPLRRSRTDGAVSFGPVPTAAVERWKTGRRVRCARRTSNRYS